MDRLTAAQRLIQSMTEQELVSFTASLLNCELRPVSDRVSDLFYAASEAFQRDCFGMEIEIARPAGAYVPARAA